MTPDVVVLGATGTAGRLIAAELTALGATVALAGRDPRRLAATAAALPGPAGPLLALDLADPAGLARTASSARLVLNTVGPFARLAPPVIDACLAAGTPYVDIANELPAVRALLARDEQARRAGATLVTGAAFGLAATEALALRLAAHGPLADVRVAALPSTAHDTDGARASVAATLPEGATRYRGGRLVRSPLGSGAETVPVDGADRLLLPLPVGDLEAARRATGAADVTALGAAPADRGRRDTGRSLAYADALDAAGARIAAELRTGEAFAAGAAIAARTALGVLAGPRPGAWTPCALLGADLVTAAGCTVTDVPAPAAVHP